LRYINLFCTLASCADDRFLYTLDRKLSLHNVGRQHLRSYDVYTFAVPQT